MKLKIILEYFLLLIKSIIIGICAILPGVSGSVIAVSFGIYQKVLSSISNIKQNILFFIILIIGVIIGMYYTSGIILQILKHKTIVYYSLIGIILSEVPFMIKKIYNDNSKGIMIIPFVLSFLFSLVLDLLNKNAISYDYSSIRFFIGGILFSFGKVFPGISSSFFLLSLGIYGDIIIVISKPILLLDKINYYLPFVLGTVIGMVVFILLLRYLLKTRFRFLYSVILGFIISSVLILFPEFSLDISNIVGIICMIFFFFIFTRLKNKNNE